MAITLTVIALIVFVLLLGWITSREGGKEDATKESIVTENYIHQYIFRCNSDVPSKKKVTSEKSRTRTSGGKERDKKNS